MTNELAVRSNGEIDFAAFKTNIAEVAENFATSLDGSIDLLTWPQIRVPSGGAQVWGMEDGQIVQTFDALIAAQRRGRVYYQTKFGEGERRPPQCFSVDGITGIGDPGGECARCPLAKFGSSTSGGGQACREFRSLAVIRHPNPVPELLTVPPTSIKAFKALCNRALVSGSNVNRCIVRISLEKARNKGGIDYSTIKFEVVARLSGDNLEMAKEFNAMWMQIFENHKHELVERSGGEARRTDSELSDDLPDGIGAAPQGRPTQFA